MNASYYVVGISVTLLGLWFLWFYGWQEYLVARFRDRLFSLRSELFVLAAKGSLDFDGPVYCGLRFRLNALLRFAHRVSFLSLIIASLAEPKPSRGNPYRDKWRAGLSELPSETRVIVAGLEEQMAGALASQIVWGSLLLGLLAWVVRFGRAVTVLAKLSAATKITGAASMIRSTEDVLEIARLKNGARLLEDEAYREESDHLKFQTTLA